LHPMVRKERDSVKVDTYQVVKRVVQAEAEGKKFDFKVQRYYATFYGRDPETEGNFQDPFVEVWADGSITAHWRDSSLWLYDDQWKGVIKAVQQAMKDIEEKQKARREQWLAKTADVKEFEGVPVDLSRNEVIDTVTNCKMDIEIDDMGGSYTRPKIFYNGEWYSLGRTDLMDDVATGMCANFSIRKWRKHYLRSARNCYGGRIRKTADGKRMLFSIIDSFTDG